MQQVQLAHLNAAVTAAVGLATVGALLLQKQCSTVDCSLGFSL